MSLYGSGRREGIGSVLLIAALVLSVTTLGRLFGEGLAIDLAAASRQAIVPATAGALFYRVLRAQGRSRYAAFLTGIAYAISPWLLSLAGAGREHLAAALAPLALEAASRCDRPSTRAAWLPWTGACLAAPFLAGSTPVESLRDKDR